MPLVHLFLAECMLCDWHHDKARLTIAEAEQDNRDHEAIHHKPTGLVHAIVPIENAAGELPTCGICKRTGDTRPRHRLGSSAEGGVVVSGSWESAMVDEAIRYGDPDTRPTHMFKAYKTARQAGLIKGLRPLTSMGKSQEEAFLYGIRTVLQIQAEWGSYPTVEAIWELRRGEASIFYPLFKEDPTIWVECPSPRVHVAGARVTTDYRGECGTCGYDLVTGVLANEQEQ